MLTVYDPRKCDDFRFQMADGEFSSLSSGFLVVTSRPSRRLFGIVTQYPFDVDLSGCRDLIAQAIRTTSRRAFFATDATSEQVRAEMAAVEGYQEAKSTTFGYLDLARSDLDWLLQVRSDAGAKGEWQIGGEREALVPPTESSSSEQGGWNLDHFLTQADRLGCLFLQAGNEILFLSRLFDGVDALANLAKRT